MSTSEPDRIALAYSGGLDTSVMIPWLRERYGAEVVAVVGDVGQGEDLDRVRDKALESGAAACVIEDLKSEFVRNFVFPALRAGAVYEGRYLLGTALARPIIAAAQVRAAREHGCDALAHGCTGKGNDQVRFELTYAALAPDLAVVAPWREWDLRSRADATAFARARGIPVPTTAQRPYSVDRNLWHSSYEGGVLEDPATPPPDGLFEITADVEDTPDEPRTVEIRFEEGIPTGLDGELLEPVELVTRLNELAAAHGVGRVDLVENRIVGMKSRGAYETPGGTVLLAALRDLEALVLDRETARFKDTVSRRYADLVYEGRWFEPLREALDAFAAETGRAVTGTVTVRLHRGRCIPVARSAPRSLYSEDLATFGEDEVYDQSDAEGFIRLRSIPTRLHAALRADGDEGEAAVQREREEGEDRTGGAGTDRPTFGGAPVDGWRRREAQEHAVEG